MLREPRLRVSRPGRRSGFTLIEIMIVVGIISILIALGAGAYQQVVLTQQKSVTELLLSKVASELKNQITAAVDKAKNESIPPEITNLAGNDSRRAKVLWVKTRLRKEFPESLSEADFGTDFQLTSVGYTIKGIPTYQNQIGARRPSDTGNDSSMYLLWALKQNRRGMTFDPEVSLGAQATRTRASDGYVEIIDGWGAPIKFNRSLTGTGSDPYDPENVFGPWAITQPGSRLADITKAIGYNPAAVPNQVTVDVGPSLISLGRDGIINTSDDLESRFLRQ